MPWTRPDLALPLALATLQRAAISVGVARAHVHLVRDPEARALLLSVAPGDLAFLEQRLALESHLLEEAEEEVRRLLGIDGATS